MEMKLVVAVEEEEAAGAAAAAVVVVSFNVIQGQFIIISDFEHLKY